MSPFAWYFPRIARASSFLPFDTSHLGLSGTNTINPRIWNNGYDICSRHGTLHDQLFDMPIVAYVTAAELMAPKLQHALYRAVAVCRCRGCAFSVARRGAAVWAMPIPMPDRILVPKKAQWLLTAAWMIAPTIAMLDPMPTHVLRPNLSAI
jgi:hypothetical protein